MSTSAYFLIFEYYFYYFFLILIITIYFIKAYKEKTLFIGRRKNQFNKSFVQKYKKQCTIVVKGALIVYLAFIAFYGFLILPDLPNVITNNYKTSECIVKTDIKNKTMHCNIDNQNIEIIHDTLLEDKTRIKINYFYHVPVGCVDEIIN